MFPEFSYQSSQQAEISIPGQPSPGNQGSTFFFPDLPQLRPDNAIIKGIELFTNGTQAVSPSTGTTVLEVSAMQNLGLTLYGTPTFLRQSKWFSNNPFEFHQNIPLIRFNTMQNNANDPFSRFFFVLGESVIDFSKSYVRQANGVLGNTEDRCIPFVIYYDLISNRMI